MSITGELVDTSIWKDGAEESVRVLAPEVGAWALSPDDEWIAFAEPLPDESGQCAVWCAEVSTGRVIFEKRGGLVKALGWPSNESLLVVREQTKLRARAVIHAVPDGGVMGSLALDALPGARCKVSFAGGAVSVALVAPVRWHGAMREREPSRRLAYVLRTDPLEVIASYDPDESSALPRVPEVRAAVASLAPEGNRLVVWQGAPSREGVHGSEAGVVLVHDWTAGRDVRVLSAGMAVEEIAWMGPDTLVLRSSYGTEPVHRGEVEVVDLRAREVLYSSVGEDPPDGWVGARATVDVHPDRDRILVAGRRPERGRGSNTWHGVLREIVPRASMASAPRGVASNVAAAMGVAWTPPRGESFAVLRAKKKAEAEIVRLRTIDGDIDGDWRVAVTLEGRKPAGGRLARSPGNRYLVAHWNVEPENTAHAKRRLGSVTMRYLYGPVSATRLMLVRAGEP